MATIASPAARLRSDRNFYTATGFVLAATVFWGFAPSFYLSHWMTKPPTAPEIGTLLALHGTAFTAWFILMAVQPLLIATRNTAIHRKLGWFGAAVAAAMFLLGNLAAIAGMNTGFRGLGDPYVFYAVPFFGINSFAIVALLAILKRNQSETHKRLILLSNVGLLGAAIARIPLSPLLAGAPFTFIFLPNLISVAGAIHDLRSRGKVHRVWKIGGPAMFAVQIVMMAVMGTSAWHGFAETMAGLWR